MRKNVSIAYVAAIRFPTERAHGLQIARVLGALSHEGVPVTLYVPRRRNHIPVPWNEYYQTEKSFRVEYVPCLDLLWGIPIWDTVAYIVLMKTFGSMLLFLGPKKESLVVTRDKMLAFWFSLRGFKVVFNAHTVTGGWWFRFCLERVMGVIANSEGTKKAVDTMLSKPSVAIHNGADQNSFLETKSSTLREELSLPLDRRIVVYAGHLYAWKGANVLFEIAELLRGDDDPLIVVVGGTEEDVARYRKKAAIEKLTSILYVGHVPSNTVPKYLRAADLLILPNTKDTEESESFTSPIKLFEYLASGRPIIASDLPSVRAILSEEAGYFALPGDAEAFASIIRDVLSPQNAILREVKGKTALTKSRRYTWEAHAKTFIAFCESVAYPATNIEHVSKPYTK